MTTSSPSSVLPADDSRTSEVALPWQRPVWSVVVALTATVLTYALLASGVLPGLVSLSLVAGLVVAVPTSAELAHRVALNLAILVGWTPVLWWVRWPFPVDHAALVVALAVGVLAVVVLRSGNPVAQLRRWLPRVRPVDSLMLVGAGLGLAAMWRWAFPGSPRAALVVMLPGFDGYAHFHMFSTIRRFGAVTQALGGVGDGSGWAFDDYPQGFHAFAATVSELTRPHLATGPPALSAYTQVVATTVVVGLVAMTAALVSLPGLRRRPLVALPVVVVTWAGFLWSPGQNLLADGFANFWLAAAAAGLALVLSIAPQRRLGFPEVAAVAGLLLSVAYAWAPLIVVAAPAALALFMPVRQTVQERALRSRLVVAVAVLGVAAIGVLRALRGLFTQVDVGTVVSASGGIHGASPTPTFFLVLVAVAGCMVAPRVVARSRGSRDQQQAAQRARLLVLAPLAGVLLTAMLLFAQLHTVGTSAYYLVKLVMGLELVMAAFVPAVVGLVVTSIGPLARHRAVAVLAAGVTTLIASQSFGFVTLHRAPLFEAGRNGTAAVGPPYDAARIARGIVTAADGSNPATSFELDYLAIGRDRAAQGFYPDGWYHAIMASLSADVGTRLGELHGRMPDVEAATPVARHLLENNAHVVLVVAPEFVDPLRARLGAQGLGDRVRAWSDPSISSVQPERER